MQLIKVVVVTPGWLDSSLFTHSYLVMPFMGTDLGKLMKLERLTEDRVQFLVYQMLKGLKVTAALPAPVKVAERRFICLFSWVKPKLLMVSLSSLSSVYPLCRDHPQGVWTLTFQTMSFGGEGLLFFFRFGPIHPDSHTQSFPHTHKRLIRCFFQHCLKRSTCLFDFTCQVYGLLQCLHQ